jgi:hypothetical protein
MPSSSSNEVAIGPRRLAGFLGLPEIPAKGLVIFAHGSGSGRLPATSTLPRAFATRALQRCCSTC